MDGAAALVVCVTRHEEAVTTRGETIERYFQGLSGPKLTAGTDGNRRRGGGQHDCRWRKMPYRISGALWG